MFLLNFCTQPSPLLLYTFLDCRTGLLNSGQITRLNCVGQITRLNRVDQSQGSIWVIHTHTHSPYVVIAQPKGCAIRKVMPLLGPSCKSRLFRFSAKLKFQDGPSVAIKLSECVTSISSSNTFPAFIIEPAAASKYSSHSSLLYTTCCFDILIISIF